MSAPALTWETPAAWAGRALEEPLLVLADHAHCELGAAAAAQALIARHPGLPRLVECMAALAAEEMRHFRRVHRALRARGGELGPVRPNAYVDGLRRAAHTSRRDRDDLVDRLLVGGLIERRSLERFGLLAAEAAGKDDDLAGLWAGLGPSEEAHAALFLDLARDVAGAEAVARRQAELARAEAELARGLPFAHRIHGGPPAREAVAAEARP